MMTSVPLLGAVIVEAVAEAEAGADDGADDGAEADVFFDVVVDGVSDSRPGPGCDVGFDLTGASLGDCVS